MSGEMSGALGVTPVMKKTSSHEEASEPDGSFSDVGRYSGYGMAFAATIGLGFGVGIWLDQKFDTAPLFALLGAFAGFGSGFYTLYVRFILEPQSKRDENG